MELPPLCFVVIFSCPRGTCRKLLHSLNLLRSQNATPSYRQDMNKAAIVLTKKAGAKILVLRNQKVILDTDLAELYGVPVKRLNEQVKRNPERFPADFRFTLTPAEYQDLRSQKATSSSSHGGRRYLPNAFTEHGAIMAASVLNSKRAVEMSIFVVRAFVRMREVLLVNQKVVSKLSELESRLDDHDVEIQDLIEAIRELMAPPPANNRRIGFEAPADSTKN
jgi:ORF6N domain